MSGISEYGESLIKMSPGELQTLIDDTDVGIVRYTDSEKRRGVLTAAEYRLWERLLKNQAVHVRAQCAQTLTRLLMDTLRRNLMPKQWNPARRK